MQDSIVLDHQRGTELNVADPPFGNFQAFRSGYIGLHTLAMTVRQCELHYASNDRYAANVAIHVSSVMPDIVPCAFNWFAVTLVNYLRLVALVELMNVQRWKSSALIDAENRSTIRKHCTSFVKEAAPEVCVWRNKVAAHAAATDPFHDDNLGTLEQSIMNPIAYRYPYYYVGLWKWQAAGETSQLPSWALTKTYEDLSERFWPEMRLAPTAAA